MSSDLKAQLRRHFRAERRALSPELRAAASVTIAALADRWLPRHGLAVGLYAAMGSEVDTAPLAVRLTARGLACAFPLVEGDRLVFVVCPPSGLVAGYRGGLEPPAELPPIDPASLAAVIVPGLGFTRSGGRLGQGGGFYDRWLAAHRLPTLGLGFGVQLADTLPLEPHDVLLDAVATERGLVERTP